MIVIIRILEYLIIYGSALIFSKLTLGNNFLFLNYQPNLYLLTVLGLTLYQGITPFVIGFVLYGAVHYYTAKSLPSEEKIRTLLIFGSVALLFFYVYTRKATQLSEELDYLKKKLEELLRNFYILKVSYDQISKRYILHMPLRIILERLKKEFVSGQINKAMEELNHVLLNEFGVKSFAFHRKSSFGYELIYSTENYKDIPKEVWNEVIEKVESNLCIVKSADLRLESMGFMSCIPIIGEDDNIDYVLIIQDMMFKYYTLENLQLIWITLSYLFSQYEDYKNKDIPILCSEDFTKELMSSIKLKSSFGVESSVVVVQFSNLPADIMEELYKFIKKNTRVLDAVCMYEGGVFCLLPLTDSLGAEGFINRLKTHFKNYLGVWIDERVNYSIVPVSADLKFMEELLGWKAS